MGWFETADGWLHEVLPYTILPYGNLPDLQMKKTMHALRQSIRWHAYQSLFDSTRHEFHNAVIPPFSEERLQLAKNMAKNDGRALSFCIGAKMIPYAYRKRKEDPPPTCPKCGDTFYWAHYWKRGLGRRPPADVLQKRFLWPMDLNDVKVAQDFMNVVASMPPVTC